MGAQCTCSATDTSELLVETPDSDEVRPPRAPNQRKIDILSEEYQLEGVGSDGILGHSSIGTVVKTKHKTSSKVHAVKQICKRNIEGEEWKEEIQVMKELDHPNICKINDTWEDAMNIYLVMEFCKGGHLTELGEEQSVNEVNETTVSVLVRQMVGAVAHLHEHKVAHSDIRPENWLFQEKLGKEKRPLDAQLKMVDFGFSTKYGRQRPRRISGGATSSNARGSSKKSNAKEDRSLFCKAPEQVPENGNVLAYEKEKADIWALGILSYFLLSGHSPFGSPDKDKLFKTASFVFMPRDVWRPVSSEAKNFIAMCLQQSPGSRMSAEEALRLPWMNLANRAMKEEEELKRIGSWPPMEGFKTREKLSFLDPPLPAAEKIRSTFARMNQLNVLEKTAVIAAAHKLSEDKLPELLEAYAIMDVNGEGVITTQEFFDGLESCGVPCKELASLIRGMDVNGSRMIEYSDFIGAIEDFQGNMQDSAVWAVFRNFDSEGNQAVMKKKLLEALGSNAKSRDCLADNFPELKVQEVLQELDHDGDEVIGFEEFKAILKESGASKRPSQHGSVTRQQSLT